MPLEGNDKGYCAVPVQAAYNRLRYPPTSAVRCRRNLNVQPRILTSFPYVQLS